jgi:hypothetical protein
MAQQGLLQQWAAGSFQGDTPHETGVLNSAALGELQGYVRIQELNHELLLEVLEDDDE